MASEQGLARVLLGIASTEDRVISTLLDHQTRQELGCGTQIVEVEQVTLSRLHKLLTEPEAGASMMSGPMGNAVRSSSAEARSHFLLTLAHYTYFHHRPELYGYFTLLLTVYQNIKYWDRYRHQTVNINMNRRSPKRKCRRDAILVIKCSLVILLNLQHYEVNMQILFQIVK